MSDLSLNGVAIPSDLSFFFLEDTVFFQERMLESLVQLGFTGTVTTAETIADAVKMLADLRPDFILSDWNLPDGKGINFLRFIRLNPDFDKTPFVMVTTMDDVSNILNAASMGVDGYVVKPWTEEELVEKLSFAFEKRQAEAT